MQNFSYHNPVKIIFGRGTIAQVREEIPAGARVLIAIGQGSVRRNGILKQATDALKDIPHSVFEGIEPNPRYETLMKAVDICRRDGVGFLLSVGGGSVLDGTKFIAAAARFDASDPWDILSKHAPVGAALPLGAVLTLPATGSEMNTFAVISRESTREKLAFGSPHVYPRFSVLDPETTFTLPPRQTGNGIVDAFAHVMEQYMTFPSDAPLQDRQAEAILLTLVEEGPKALARPDDYKARANVMWAATNALNGLIGCGVPQDWSTHMIGHELTAFYGLDHAQTLAIAMPGVLELRKAAKWKKLLQFGERIWGIREGREEQRVTAAIARMEEFFRSVHVPTRLSDYGHGPQFIEAIADRLGERGGGLGEHGDIGRKEVLAILKGRA